MVRFSRGNLVKIQRNKLIINNTEDNISVEPKVLFDFFKDKINIKIFPNKLKAANKITEKSFRKATTLNKLLQATRSHMILL